MVKNETVFWLTTVDCPLEKRQVAAIFVVRYDGQTGTKDRTRAVIRLKDGSTKRVLPEELHPYPEDAVTAFRRATEATHRKWLEMQRDLEGLRRALMQKGFPEG